MSRSSSGRRGRCDVRRGRVSTTATSGVRVATGPASASPSTPAPTAGIPADIPVVRTNHVRAGRIFPPCEPYVPPQLVLWGVECTLAVIRTGGPVK
eukprot:1195185-Prorocentrum_minimum.AAC.3